MLGLGCLSHSIELHALQEIDDEAAALSAAIEAVELKLKGDRELDDARRSLQYLDQQLKRLRGRQRRTESEIEEMNKRIVPDQKRLYDGSIHSPKDLEVLQREVNFLVANRSRLEDTLLEHLAEIEEVERQQREAATQVAQLESRWETQQLELRQDARKLGDKLAEVTKRRNGQSILVPPRMLHLYDDLRRRKGGVAVAPIRSGGCGSCRVTLPGALKSKALDPDTLVQCPNCERILTLG